jgi:hypothetical protein
MAVYPKLNAILLQFFHLFKYYSLPLYDQLNTTFGLNMLVLIQSIHLQNLFLELRQLYEILYFFCAHR